MLQLVRRKEPLTIFQESPRPQPAAEGHNNAVSKALITVLSINVFVIASVGAFYLLLFFYR